MFDMHLEKHWLGPTKNLWGHDQCNSLGPPEYRNGLEACKRDCMKKESCTAIIVKKVSSVVSQFSCDLRDCDLPVPEPTSSPVDKSEGYYIATGKNQIYI